MRMRLLLCAGVATVAAVAAPVALAGRNPQVAGLQVALRARGLYDGAIDAIRGPLTTQAIATSSARTISASPAAPGPAPAERSAARPPALREAAARCAATSAGTSPSSSTSSSAAGSRFRSTATSARQTARGVRRFQRRAHLVVDGIVGPMTRAALAGHTPHARRSGSTSSVQTLLDHWAAHYGVNVHLVRGLAWMESGYNNRLVSSTGARGIMQIEPYTWRFVETVLIGHRVRHGPSGNIHVGVSYLHHLLGDFHGNTRRALAGWYQGERAVRRHGDVQGHAACSSRDVLSLAARM